MKKIWKDIQYMRKGIIIKFLGAVSSCEKGYLLLYPKVNVF